MDSFKEFEGKSLDEVISEACGYFDSPREKLEIEILQDAKSGIFGLVGARKAKVRARRVTLRTAVEDILGRKHGLTLLADGEDETDASAAQSHDNAHDRGHERASEKPHEKSHDKGRDADAARKDRHSHHEKCHVSAGPTSDAFAETAEEFAGPDRLNRLDRSDSMDHPEGAAKIEHHDRPDRTDAQDRPARVNTADRPDRPDRQDRPERSDGRRAKPAPKVGTRRTERPAGERPADERQGDGRDGRHRPKAAPRPRSDENTFPNVAFSEDVLREDGDDLQRIPFEDLDQDRLRTLSLEVVGKLVAPIVGELPLTVELQDGRVNVRMDCGDDSGLLIGREGQTLASLQYLASRMVSRGMNTAVRVQLDAGEYRLRQDEKLREMALGLADRVRATGKSHSTRPLSSYHRRIVHLVLQDSTDVQTRSSGDGPLKRVVVQRKRG